MHTHQKQHSCPSLPRVSGMEDMTRTAGKHTQSLKGPPGQTVWPRQRPTAHKWLKPIVHERHPAFIWRRQKFNNPQVPLGACSFHYKDLFLSVSACISCVPIANACALRRHYHQADWIINSLYPRFKHQKNHRVIPTNTDEERIWWRTSSF